MTKKWAVAIFILLGSVTSFALSDRCQGLMVEKISMAEPIALMHIDIRHHENTCRFEKDFPERHVVEMRIAQIYQRYAKFIRMAQDVTTQHLGGEREFNSYYVDAGNQISFLFLSSPCERLLMIANIVLNDELSYSGLEKTYRPIFSELEHQFNQKYKKHSLVFQRLCDTQAPKSSN